MPTVPAADSLDSVNNPRQPFGLPLGSVRGFLSLLICGFFWVVLLWPDPQPVRATLGHFFMLALVMLVFSPVAQGDAVRPNESVDMLPWVLRLLFVGGTLAVVAFVALQHPARFARLNPDPAEFQAWWGPFLACTFAGFAFGQLARLVLGRNSAVFQIMRAWLSVVGMLSLVSELVFWVAVANADNRPEEFIHYWQSAELVVVAGYFGARA